MTDSNPDDIFNAYKNSELDKQIVAEKLISFINKSKNEDFIEKLVCSLDNFYSNYNKRTKELIELIADRVGKHYIDKYQIKPIEAIALKFLELIDGDEIVCTNTGLDCYSYITFFVENSNVSEIYTRNIIPNLKILGLFKQIEKLKIYCYEIVYDDINLIGLSNLTTLKVIELNIYGLKNIEVLCGLENLTNLRELHITEAWIEEIKYIENLINLEKLTIAGDINYDFQSNISEINYLGKLVKLKELKLYSNKIREIKGLETLVNLELLDLSGNCIREIKGLSNLTNLKKLNLEKNKITEIKDLDSLVNLEELKLNENEISKINRVKNLVNLKTLTLSKNYITRIQRLDSLINLEFLDLRKNKIKRLEGLESLINLKNLFIRENKITEIEDINRSETSWGVHHPEDFVEYCRYNKTKIDLAELPTIEIINMYKNKKLHKHLWEEVISILEKRGESDKVQSFYELAVNTFPGLLRVWKLLSSIYKAENKLDKLIVAYENIVVLDPNRHEIWNRLISIYEDTDNSARIIDTYKRIVDVFPLESKGWFDLAKVYFENKNYKDALNSINHTLKLDPRFKAALRLKEKITKLK